MQKLIITAITVLILLALIGFTCTVIAKDKVSHKDYWTGYPAYAELSKLGYK